MTYRDRIKKLVKEWKNSRDVKINDSMTLKDGIELEFKMKIFVYKHALEKIEEIKKERGQ